MRTDADTTATLPHDPRAAYLAVQRGAAFTRLRSRSRRYVTAMTALVLGLFTGAVVVAGWFPGVLAARVAGNVTAGIVLAAGLIVLPAVTCAVHLRYAGRRLDPLVERIRDGLDGGRR
ncbi:DUF485 domain-containing protein [Dactylosporangium sp. NPDC050688]|uniref:DUF485 domain-containing protein n=1 Tax=Dactylosporangium sp. NPDC050688 TaxID=3157217 RepID=UPI00340911FF